MIKELLYKLFGIEERCRTCEILQAELESCKRLNDTLLQRLIRPAIESVPPIIEEEEPRKELKALSRPRFIPHAVREQMMMKEDSKALELMLAKKKEIAVLEKEVGVAKEKDDASKVS